MKLKTISVERYRSITKAKKIGIDKLTVLVGPNNEGKSNILRALVVAMTVLTRGRRVLRDGRRKIVSYNHEGYNWDLDFPVSLQQSYPDGQSVIILEFELTDHEHKEFKKETRSTITGLLPLKISIGKGQVSISYNKRGSGSAQLSKNSLSIASFVSDRIDFEYVQAVRTAESAGRVVRHMVVRELSVLDENEEYNEALKKIEKLQIPILKKLSKSIKKTLNTFLPEIKDVSVSIDSSERYRALNRSFDITVNDGVPTLLSYKGDGVQSLAALGLMRHYSESNSGDKSFIIAIEEPESHLHPNAIHELKKVIDELSNNHQILITTHNPLFVDRRNIKNNIIVINHKAKPARNIKEIRDLLGIRASDNLVNARYVLVVEGEFDKISIEVLLSEYSDKIKKSINNHMLAIEYLGGAGKLSSKLSMLRISLCVYHCLLDNDKSGQDAYNKAEKLGFLSVKSTTFTKCKGLKESEFEDCLNFDVYKNNIRNNFGVDIDVPEFKSKKKWSNRIRDCFSTQGKPWNDKVETDVKSIVAECVAQNPKKALNRYKRNSIDALITSLEEMISDNQ